LLVLLHAPAFAEDCGSLSSNYGPYDYRTDKPKLGIVERHHFTAQVETLRGGLTAVTPGPDLEYTLKTFPNHHRALVAVVRYAKRLGGARHLPHMQYTVDCHFDRALRFREDDEVVRMLFASWLGETGRREAGLKQLDLVKANGNAFTIYNLGMVHAELGAYEKALELAHASYAMGFSRPTLQRILQKAGHWRDPDASPSQMAVPAASAPKNGD